MAEEPQQRHSELASFGEELRREREIRGISLKEISDATKISKRFLEAIEKNDHRTLPAPVFTRGFVREYARYLGLASEEIVNRYNFAAAGDDRIEQSTHLDRLVQPQAVPLARDRERERKSIPPPYARIDRNVYILVVIVAALVAASYWAFKHKRETHAEEARVDTAAAIAPKPVAPSPAPVPAPEPPPVDDTLRLTIDVTHDTWLTLEADGKTAIDERLRTGDHRAVEAKESFRFVAVGNAGGLTLKLNDLDLPSLGRLRQVIKDKTVDRGTLQELRSEIHNRT
jgi:transcriptional regulator with XRE-family HTH domain